MSSRLPRPRARRRVVDRRSRVDRSRAELVDDLADDLTRRGVRTREWPTRSVAEAIDALLLVAPEPVVVGVAADPGVATLQGDVPRHLLGVADDRPAGAPPLERALAR